MCIEDRNERLAALNAFLAERNLKPRDKLGLASAGEQEILGIYHVDERTPKFHRTIYCAVQLKDERILELPMRYNANGAVADGSVFIILIRQQDRSYIVFTKEWRHSVGDWVTGLPRGFTDDSDLVELGREYSLGTIGSIQCRGLRVVLREMGEEIGDNASFLVDGVANLGSPYQNTGTDNAAPDNILLTMTLAPGEDVSSLKWTPTDPDVVHKVRIVEVKDVRHQICRMFNDDHTLIGLMLADRHLRSPLDPLRSVLI
jgi:hypothetical protein